MTHKNHKEFLNAIVEGKAAVVADLCINNSAFFQDREGLKCQALSLAAGYGQTAILKMLLTNGFEGHVAGRDNWPLRWAVENGHFDVINILLDYEAVRKNIAVMDYMPLIQAASQQFHEICYVIAETCWGSIKKIPQDLKNHRQWQTIIHSIRQGAIQKVKEIRGMLRLKVEEPENSSSIVIRSQVANNRNLEQTMREMIAHWWGDGLRHDCHEMIKFFSERIEREDYVMDYPHSLDEYTMKSKL